MQEFDTGYSGGTTCRFFGPTNGALPAREHVSACHRGNLPFRPSRRVSTPEGISSPKYLPALLRCDSRPEHTGGVAARHERRDDGLKYVQERCGPYDNG